MIDVENVGEIRETKNVSFLLPFFLYIYIYTCMYIQIRLG